MPGTGILLARRSIAAGGEATLTIPAISVAWLRGLEGEARPAHGGNSKMISNAHVAILPLGFSGTLRTARVTAFLSG